MFAVKIFIQQTINHYLRLFAISNISTIHNYQVLTPCLTYYLRLQNQIKEIRACHEVLYML